MSAVKKLRRTSSAGVSPASISLALETVAASMARALACGENSCESSGRHDRNGSSPKTWRCSLGEGSPLCSGTLPRSGMLRGGTVFPLPPSVPLTSATGYSWSRETRRFERDQAVPSRLWPTPTATYWSSKDAENTLRRWRGTSTNEKAKNPPTVGELVYALHGGLINLDWMDALQGFPPGWTRES